MSLDLEARRAHSARHYLLDRPLATRLSPTITLAARALGFPIAMVNILDERLQHTVGRVGMALNTDLPRSEALCDVVVRGGQPVVATDTGTDQRFSTLPLVVAGQVGAYIGVPLLGRESLVIGTICVVDTMSRPVDSDQLARLIEFGKVVEDQLDLLRRLKEQRQDGQVATAELARAVRSGEIMPWYQPIFALSTGTIVGFEALARWERPSGEVADPNSFVPLAEDSDLIVELDLMVMRRALADLRRWQGSTGPLHMSVNLSSRHFNQPDWLGAIVAVAAEAGVDPGSVNLELTESAQLPVEQSDGAFVKRLREHGFQVWLDDFGTGWSAMEHLLRLPADGIKIDRVISVALGTHVGDTLARSVIGLAHDLGMQTTIEGIETSTQAALAADLGCDFAQGFLWSGPVPARDIDAHGLSGTFPAGPGRRAPVGAVTSATSIHPDLAAAVLDALPDATAVLDASGTIVAVNQAWRMYALDNGGSEDTNGIGVSYFDVCDRAAAHGNTDARQVAAHIREVLTGASVEAELEYPCPSPARDRWFLMRVSRLHGAIPHAVVSHVNITRRKLAEDELSHAGSHDPLSGLANRMLLNAKLTKALRPRDGRRPSGTVGVLYIDLDGFKPVNDTYGHAAGDDVLVAVAHRLQSAVRPGDTVGRLGGDEFAVLMPRADPAGLAVVARRVQEALAEPHRVHGQLIAVPGSVGAYLAAPGDDPQFALHQADQAMYQAKQLHRANPLHRAEQPH